MQLGRCADFLCPFIWNRVSGLVWFHDGSDKRPASNFLQVSEKVRQRPWQWLDKFLGKKAWALHVKSRLAEAEQGETCEEQRQEHAHHFLWHQGHCSQGICPGTYYCFMVTVWKCAKTLPQTLATKVLAVASRQHRSNISFFIKKYFTKKHNCHPPPYFPLLPRLKIKLKGHHFDTLEVNEAESQVVLKTLN
jgi:hypothetical protein